MTEVLSHSSGGEESKIEVSAGLVPSGSCEGEPVPGLCPGFWWFPGDSGTSCLLLQVPGVPWRSPCVLALLGHRAVSEASSCSHWHRVASLFPAAGKAFPSTQEVCRNRRSLSSLGSCSLMWWDGLGLGTNGPGPQ